LPPIPDTPLYSGSDMAAGCYCCGWISQAAPVPHGARHGEDASGGRDRHSRAAAECGEGRGRDMMGRWVEEERERASTTMAEAPQA